MLHVRQAGHGPDLLLLHAFPLNSRMWEPQLTALADRARLIAVDFPGFGLSAPSQRAPTLTDYARAVLTTLDALQVDRVAVAGLSMGGYTAFRLVELLGERLAGLFLADTRPTADDAATVTARHELAAEVEARGVEAAADEFLPKLIGATTVHLRPALIDRVRAIMLENSAAGVAAALRAMAARPDSTSLLSRLRCPVVCVVGDEDTVTPPDVVRQMTDEIPNARLEVIAQSGHLTNLEDPETFNQHLGAFMAEVSA
jgi:3-oxoadipate enol-lactonase